MAGRSGCVIERMLVVQPHRAGLIHLLLVDALHHYCRRQGTEVPLELRAWLDDLDDLARSSPSPAQRPPPSAWVDVATAARALGLGERRVRAMAHDGVLRTRRDGRPWLLDADDVADEVEARSAVAN